MSTTIQVTAQTGKKGEADCSWEQLNINVRLLRLREQYGIGTIKKREGANMATQTACQLQTTVELKGVLGNKGQTCHFTSDAGPEGIFRGRTARELFLQSVPNPGCENIAEKDVQISIEVRRECSFGFAGFTANDVESALKEAHKLQAKSDADLLAEGMPDPLELFSAAVKELLEGKKERAEALANTFEFFAKAALGREQGQGTRKQFLDAAETLAAEIRAEK